MTAVVGYRHEVQHLTPKSRRKKSLSCRSRSKLCKYHRSKTTKRRTSKQSDKLIDTRSSTHDIPKQKPRIITQNLIISCYFRKYIKSRYSSISSDIISMIIKYKNSMELYLERLCDAKSHINLGRIYNLDHDEINMDYFIKNNKFASLCNHCGAKNKDLNFIQSHREAIDNVIGFKNNANEYECSVCHYYNVFNIKLNVLKYEICPEIVNTKESYTLRNTLTHYVTPFRFVIKDHPKFKKGIILNKESMKEPSYCPQCSTSSIESIGSVSEDTNCMEIFGVFKNNTSIKRNIFYCNVCDLFIHKMIETNCAVSYLK